MISTIPISLRCSITGKWGTTLGILLLIGGLWAAVGSAAESWPDLSNAPVVVEGIISKIRAPLVPPNCVTDCQTVPNFIFHVERTIYGQAPHHDLSFSRFVVDWPAFQVPYQEGVHCVLFINGRNADDAGLTQVVPSGRGEWKSVATHEELVNEIKTHWTAELSRAPDSRVKAELVHSLAPLLNAAEAEQTIRPLVSSSNEWVRHAAIGALLCKNPSPANVDMAKKDLEGGLRALTETFIGVGTIESGGHTEKQFMPMYYDCLSGGRPSPTVFATLWDWMDKIEREAHPSEWPNN